MHKTFRQLPSLDFLKGFEAAGRLLSFTLAARELFVTQSALSRQVQALEEGLGVKLFQRKHRALALTPAGSAFHRAVSETLRALASAADTVRGTRRSRSTFPPPIAWSISAAAMSTSPFAMSRTRARRTGRFACSANGCSRS